MPVKQRTGCVCVWVLEGEHATTMTPSMHDLGIVAYAAFTLALSALVTDMMRLM